MEIARTKRAARKHLVNDLRNLHANCSASDTTGPYRATDSYRPGQEQDKALSHFDDQPMQDAPETENPPKRRRAAVGDFDRPSLRPHRLPSHESPLETGATFRHSFTTLGRKHSPPPASSRPSELPKAERKQKASKAQRTGHCLARIRNNIQAVQKQLSGHRSNNQLHLEMERLLAGYQADLKAWNDKESGNDPQRRYNTVRLHERKHARKALNKAKATEANYQDKLKTMRDKIKNGALVTVSDDEEEGGVSLTQDFVTDNTSLWRKTPSAKKSELRRVCKNGEEVLTNPAYARQKQNELEKKLYEAERRVHIAEVDINYCCFAPLGQQYICLFPTDEHGRISGAFGKRARKKRNKPALDPEKELQKDTQAGILRTNLGSKPPLWNEIEERMKAGSFHGLADALGLGVDEHNLTEVGGKVDALERALVGTTLKRTHSWMDDEIASEDLDSESETDSNDEVGLILLGCDTAGLP
jgi:hypothetical protein